MNIKVVTVPATLPVTVAEVKSHLRVEIADDDADIERKIKAVVARLDPPDGILGRAMITQTLRYSLPKNPPAWIRLPYPPVQSVSSVKYVNTSEAETAVSSADYFLKTDQEPAYLVLKDTCSWPTDVSENDPFPFKIDFVAGYGGDPEDVPETIRLGIMMEVGDFYLLRENFITGTILTQNEFTRRIYDSFIWRHAE